jgi:hypothetical protein
MKRIGLYAITITLITAVVLKWGVASVGTPLVIAFCIWNCIVFEDKRKRLKAE